MVLQRAGVILTLVVLHWDPTPPDYAVSHYTLRVDDEALMTIPATTCTTVCEARLDVAAGPHVFTLTATSSTGTSAPATLTYDVPPLAPPTGLRIVRATNPRIHGESSAMADEDDRESDMCPRCGMEDAHDIVEGRCWDCRVAEEEADWMVEDEDEGGSPWGR